MQRSIERILTTHVGSLPYPGGRAPEGEEELRDAVRAVVRQQREVGLDLLNEGEFTKGGDWLRYADDRFEGFEPQDAGGPSLLLQGKDREEFAAFYQYAAERGTLYYAPGRQVTPRRTTWVCTGPVAYRGHEAVAREVEVLRGADPGEDAFLTSTAPGSLEVYRRNEFYGTDEEYLFALADSIAVEYEAIVAGGFVLQVDDAWLPALWDRVGMQMGLPAFLDHCRLRTDALNHALRRIPEDRIRYHMCWGSWHGPHAYDLELVHLVDILLNVKAQAYVLEGANARHEHEWAVWRKVRLPEGKILVPGVVTHATDVIEHPELVAERIGRYAGVVGKESVVAGADCGFGGRTHPQIAWAKLRSLAEGAELASRALAFA